MTDETSAEAARAATEALEAGQVERTGPNRAQRRRAASAKPVRPEIVPPHRALAMLGAQVQLLQRQNEELHSSRVQFAEMIGKVVQVARQLIDAQDVAFPDLDALDDKVLAFAIRQHRRVVLGLLPREDRTPEEDAALEVDGPAHVVVPAPPEPGEDG